MQTTRFLKRSFVNTDYSVFIFNNNPIAIVRVDVGLVPIAKTDTDLSKILAALYDIRKNHQALLVEQKGLKRTVAAMARDMKEMQKNMKAVHKAIVPRFLTLPLKSFDESKKDQLVIK